MQVKLTLYFENDPVNDPVNDPIKLTDRQIIRLCNRTIIKYSFKFRKFLNLRNLNNIKVTLTKGQNQQITVAKLVILSIYRIINIKNVRNITSFIGKMCNFATNLQEWK